MVKFIKSKPANQFVGRKEWWKLSEDCETVIGIGKKICSISVRNSNGEDITSRIAKRLNINFPSEKNNATEIRLNRTIDSFFIECQEEEIMNLLNQINEICRKKFIDS